MRLTVRNAPYIFSQRTYWNMSKVTTQPIFRQLQSAMLFDAIPRVQLNAIINDEWVCISRVDSTILLAAQKIRRITIMLYSVYTPTD